MTVILAQIVHLILIRQQIPWFIKYLIIQKLYNKEQTITISQKFKHFILIHSKKRKMLIKNLNLII